MERKNKIVVVCFVLLVIAFTSMFFASASPCYQESATIPNQTGIDGNCKLNYTGNYSFNQNFMVVEYLKPSVSYFGSSFKIKTGYDWSSTEELAIPLDCWDADSEKLSFKIQSASNDGQGGSYSNISCYNSIGWEQLAYHRDGDWMVFSNGYADTKNRLYDGNWATYSGNYAGTWISTLKFLKYFARPGDGSANIYEEAMIWNVSICNPHIVNTTKSEWENLTCSLEQMNQSRFWVEYDSNSCEDYNFTNITHYEYQVVGPEFINGSWTSWYNITGCMIGDYFTQEQNMTQTDLFGCAPDITIFEQQNQTCDFCTPDMQNTSWSEWTFDSCSENQTNQSRFFIEYDANSCSDIDHVHNISNVTHYEYNLTGPEYTNSTEWGEWNDIGSCVADNQTQVQNRTMFDSLGCGTNYLEFNYQNITCDTCTPNINYTEWSEWTNITECRTNNTLLQERNMTEYDSVSCADHNISNVTHYETQEIFCDWGAGRSISISFIPPTETSESTLDINQIKINTLYAGEAIKNYSYNLYDSDMNLLQSFRLGSRAISLGDDYSCTLLSNGNVTCWGNDNYNQSENYTQGDAIQVSAGGQQTCALLSNGNINCWGNNNYNQSENYTQGDAIQVSAGKDYTCALLNNGNVSCWGNDNYGDTSNYTEGNAIQIATGSLHTCALLNNGNITCWGDNVIGQTENYTQGNAIQVSLGYWHTCALLNNGNVTCWGDNVGGQSENYTQGDAIQVSAGEDHTCALTNTGNVNCWGDNNYNQSENYTLGDAIQVSAGYQHTCALLNNGNITCWGDNTYGETNPYTQGDAKKTPYYYFHSLNNGTFYYFDATACDIFGNCNSTERRNVTISASASGSKSYSSFLPETIIENKIPQTQTTTKTKPASTKKTKIAAKIIKNKAVLVSPPQVIQKLKIQQPKIIYLNGKSIADNIIRLN